MLITVRMVDANGTAIPDSQTQVRIFVVPTAQNGGVPATQSPSAPQAKNTESAQPDGRVQTASVLPDSASLLPVAAVVGFSFLLGGIVCGWKTRP